MRFGDALTPSKPPVPGTARRLRLPQAATEALCAHARAQAPHEACGLLIGRVDGPVLEVANAWPANNDFETHRSAFPAHARTRSLEGAYAIAPTAILGAHRSARARGLALIGAYHSHVHTDAQLSPLDRAMALDDSGRPLWPGGVHVVVSLPALAVHAADALRAFFHDAARGDFVELEVIAG